RRRARSAQRPDPGGRDAGRGRGDLPAGERRRDQPQRPGGDAGGGVGQAAAAAARAAPRRRDPAQLLAGGQGPRPARVRPAGAAGRGAGAHLALVPGRLSSATGREAEATSTGIWSALRTMFSAILIDAASISLPSSETAPLPSAAACCIASMIRRVRSLSLGVGVNTAFASAIWEGWIAHLPSQPSWAALRAAAV